MVGNYKTERISNDYAKFYVIFINKEYFLKKSSVQKNVVLDGN